MDTFDYLVIGAGSGGIASARRAAEHGARVAVVEQGRLGGTCVNVGCVPKKVMWNAGHVAETLADGVGYGFAVPQMSCDWGQLVNAREAYIRRLNGIYADNLANSGVTLIEGTARFLDGGRVAIADKQVAATRILVATGGRPEVPDLPGAELGITSDGFFALTERPERALVIGAGYIAVELAGVLHALGCDTTLAVRGERPLRSFDPLLGETLATAMRERGLTLRDRFTPARLREQANGMLFADDAAGHVLGPFDVIIWAVGRVPNVDGLALGRAGVSTDTAGYVETDEWQATTAENVFAVGDVTGRIALTPVAIAAGRRLSDRLFGGMTDRKLDYSTIPTVVFSHPPIGTVGLSEPQAREQFGDAAVKVYQTRFTDMYYALTEHKPKTAMKLVTVGSDERIVGCHAIGRGADELIQGFAVALKMGARKRDLDDTVAIHPTAAEEMVLMR
ncbi:MAG: glutathione-disulfide reductase [Pseudomonadota bacterium]|nr:glutathione-disulfide reductase [Pseudomonadota bacterium]